MTHSSEMQLHELNRRLDRKVQQLEALIDLGRVLAGMVDPEEVARRLGLTMAGQWALRSFAVITFRDGRAPQVRQKGMPSLEKLDPTVAAEVASWLSPFVLNEASVDGTFLHQLHSAGVQAVVPL